MIIDIVQLLLSFYIWKRQYQYRL